MSASTRTPDPARQQLTVDWQSCDGHGLCAEILPELVHLDEWHFPVVRPAVPKELERLARAAVVACPKLALKITKR
ncbi:MAG: ferredoxin [Actinomycetota bacterium]|nr:ferredoxin [Actinomycetota bacterium]